ncbi:MAG TPA: sugar phosphate isomerase/epimerase [Candidatus Bathyarchaeota archaeon]|nr:sugar phosphate isomerase/epimerase [Candidatus Bathyarchaeota archaeon]
MLNIDGFLLYFMFISVRDAIIIHADKNISKVMKKLGVKGIELRFDREYKGFLPSGDIVEIRRDRERFLEEWRNSGFKATCILEVNRFCRDESWERRYLFEGLRLAEELSARAIRVDPICDEASMEDTIKNIVRYLREAADASDVRIGIENHGRIGNELTFLKRVVEEVRSENVGYTLDVANIYWSGKPLSEVYSMVEELAPRTVHTHMKNIGYPEELRDRKRELGYMYSTYVSPLYEGDIDLGRIVDILRDNGYDWDLCVEDESLGKYKGRELEILMRDVEHLKRILEKT